MWSEKNFLQNSIFLPTATLLVTLSGRCYARHSFPLSEEFTRRWRASKS